MPLPIVVIREGWTDAEPLSVGLVLALFDEVSVP